MSDQLLLDWKTYAVILGRAIDQQLMIDCDVTPARVVPVAALWWATVYSALHDAFNETVAISDGDRYRARTFFKYPRRLIIDGKPLCVFEALGIDIEYMQSVLSKAPWWEDGVVNSSKIDTVAEKRVMRVLGDTVMSGAALVKVIGVKYAMRKDVVMAAVRRLVDLDRLSYSNGRYKVVR